MTQADATLLIERVQTRHSRPLSRILAGGIVALLDLCVVLLVACFVYYAYVRTFPAPMNPRYIAAIGLGGLLAIEILRRMGVYRNHALFGTRLAAGRILAGWSIAFSLLLALAFAFKISSDFSRVWATSWFVGTGAGLLINHGLVRWRLQRLAERGRFAARTVILGAGEHGRRLAEHLAFHADVNTRLIGFVDDRKNRTPAMVDGLPLLGDADDLLDLVRREMVDQVFVALPWSAESRLSDVVRKLARTPVEIRLTPDMIGFHFVDREFEHVARLPVLKLYERPISGWSQVAKMLEDRILAGLALLFLAPLLALIAVVIKLDSKGPVFFKQRRLGFNQNEILVWKFRTMYTDLSDADCDVQTRMGDPRVTRVGAFLRRASLDELPQLINVLLGSMSIVGPRPHALNTKAAGRLFEEVVDDYAARHRVKPGITGWAQVNGWRGETDTVEKIEKRVEYDLYYIENWSIWFDIEIVVRTLFVIVSDRNAY